MVAPSHYRDEAVRMSESLKTIAGIVAAIASLLFLGTDLLVDSKRYRQNITAGIFDVGDVAGTMFAYTPLNVAVLTGVLYGRR
jgi:hypothetical protein